MDTNFPTQQQFDGFMHFLSALVSALPKIALVAVLLVAAGFLVWQSAILLVRLLDLRRLLDRDMLFLELTPPAFADKTPLATQQFFSDLHGFETIRAVKDKMLQHKSAFAVEMVGIRDKGIRFIFCVPKDNRESFEHDIAAFDTSIRVKEIDDYLTKAQRLRARLLELRLKERYYPLKEQQSYDQSDPVDYLLGTMANLKSGEIMVIQLVLSPTKVRNADKISNRLLHNKEHLDALGKKQHRSFGSVLIQGINSAMFSMTNTVGEIHHGPSVYSRQTHHNTMQHHHQVAQGIKPARMMGSLENMLAVQVNEKLNSNLYRANIRALVVADSPRASIIRANDIRKSFNVYKTKYQAIVSRLNFPYNIRGKYRMFMFEHRLPGIFNKYASLLSATEVASVYHFPSSETNRNADVVKSLSKTLAAPLAVKNHADAQDFDVVLGKNQHLGNIMKIGLIEAERERHVFMVGGTGSGKTTLIKYAAVQDIQNDKGFAVIDPHGDLALELLTYIPEHRAKDVIYFNPDDLAYSVGLNVLELTPGLEGDELLREKDMVTESVVSMFRKIFSDDDTGGHRIEYVLRNAIQTALTIKDATLFTVYNLLNDPDYCKTVVATLDNEDLKNFWKNELGKAGGFQQVKMVAGITAKIGRFLFSASAKRVLEQPKSTINFDEILDGKILICNFSKGLLGEDTSELFGIAVLAKIQMAALRRARIKQIERKPFYLYVDEFQNFATQSFVQMLSESRKYKLFLTMAEQSTSQQDDQKMVNIILANVGTVICFRTGNPADEKLLLPLFSPYLEEGDIANLPPYNFYMRASAIKSQEPLSGETLLLDKPGSEEVAERVIKSSQERYAKKYAPPEPKEKPEAKPKPSGQATIKKTDPKILGKDRMKQRRKRKTGPKNQK
ncbi:MAG TPA: TraM recognition domain-containing protein [Candidatus Saccharimonadales bacterium]|nr:TraM recognition domain-containing protein [Candidatus Saccharimonadales bacterium]